MTFVDFIKKIPSRSFSDNVQELRDGIHARSPSNVTTSPYGVKFYGSTSIEAKRARSMIGERAILEQLLEYDGVFWDVGANAGTYAIHMARSGNQVVAFEPYPELLLRNMALNDIHFPVLPALSSSTSMTTFTNNGSESHIGGPDRSICFAGDDIPSTPDIVKIDVEGHELQVLHGMATTLDNVSIVVVECHNGSETVSDLLQGWGFCVEEIITNRSQTYLEAT